MTQAPTVTLALKTALWLMMIITEPSLITKGSVVQKMLSRQTIFEILNVHCNLKHSNPIFS